MSWDADRAVRIEEKLDEVRLSVAKLEEKVVDYAEVKKDVQDNKSFTKMLAAVATVAGATLSLFAQAVFGFIKHGGTS